MGNECPHIYREGERKIERLDTGDGNFATKSCSTSYHPDINKEFFRISGSWSDWIPLSFFILDKVVTRKKEWTEWKLSEPNYNFDPLLVKMPMINFEER